MQIQNAGSFFHKNFQLNMTDMSVSEITENLLPKFVISKGLEVS